MPINPVPVQDLRRGVTAGQEQHLLTVVAYHDEVLIVRSERLAAFTAAAGLPDPFIDIAALPQLLLNMPAADLGRIGELIRWGPDRLSAALRHGLGLDQLQASQIAAVLGGEAAAQHLLRLTATGIDGSLLSGYSAIAC